MLIVIIVLFFITLFLSLSLGLSIGVSFILTWLFPDISFEIGVVIGAICSTFSIFFLTMLITYATEREIRKLSDLYIDDEYDYVEDIEELDDYHVIPTPPTQKKNKGKRKR